MARNIFFDVLCGAGGDMILASLIDCGVSDVWLNDQLQALGIPGLSVKAARPWKNGMACVQMELSWDQESQNEYRNLERILDIIKKGNFSEAVLERCEKVLRRIAWAESQAHGCSPRHFVPALHCRRD